MREPVEQMVLQQVRHEIKDKKLVGKMVQAAHEMANAIDTSPEPLIQALRKVEQKISGLVDLVAETQNRALIAKLDELEAERARLQEERASAAERAKLKSGLRSLRTQDVAAMLEFAAAPLDGQDVDVPYLRKTLAALVRRVDLDPTSREFRVHYRVPVTGGAKLASPRPTGGNPAIRLVRRLRLYGFRRAA